MIGRTGENQGLPYCEDAVGAGPNWRGATILVCRPMHSFMSLCDVKSLPANRLGVFAQSSRSERCGSQLKIGWEPMVKVLLCQCWQDDGCLLD